MLFKNRWTIPTTILLIAALAACSDDGDQVADTGTDTALTDASDAESTDGGQDAQDQDATNDGGDATADTIDTNDATDTVDIPEIDAGPPPPNNYALEFDGDDHIQVDARADLGGFTEVTIELWFKARDDALTTRVGLLATRTDGQAYEYAMMRNPAAGSSAFRLSDDDTNCSLTTDLAGGEWHHLAGTWSETGTEAKFYVDGEEVDTASCDFRLPGALEPLLIGALEEASGDVGGRFDGFIDDVRVWRVLRTQEQIQAHMSQSLHGIERGLVAYFPFETGSGGEIVDAAGDHDAVMGTRSQNDSADPVWSEDTPFD